MALKDCPETPKESCRQDNEKSQNAQVSFKVRAHDDASDNRNQGGVDSPVVDHVKHEKPQDGYEEGCCSTHHLRQRKGEMTHSQKSFSQLVNSLRVENGLLLPP